MLLNGTDAESVRTMLREEVPRATRAIAAARPDAILFACTAAGSVAGPEGEAAIIRDVQQATGAPVASINQAIGDALRVSGANRAAVLTAFDDEVAATVAAGVERSGISVEISAGMGISDPFDIAAVTPEEILDFAVRHVAGHDVDIVLVACGNLRAVAALPELRGKLGVQVLTSNQAALAAALNLLGEDAPSPPARPVSPRPAASLGGDYAWQRVTGSTEGFCLLATRRRHRDDVDVSAVGDHADRWLSISQACAGSRPGASFHSVIEAPASHKCTRVVMSSRMHAADRTDRHRRWPVQGGGRPSPQSGVFVARDPDIGCGHLIIIVLISTRA
jgi:maleate isomerase